MSGIALVLTLFFSVLAALGLGTVAGFYILSVVRERRLAGAQSQVAQILDEAEQQKKAALLEAKEEALRDRDWAVRVQAAALLRDGGTDVAEAAMRPAPAGRQF